jgi:hypothetical protein
LYFISLKIVKRFSEVGVSDSEKSVNEQYDSVQEQYDPRNLNGKKS